MKLKFCIFFVLALMFQLSVCAAADILSDIKSLKPGCWFEIDNTRLKDMAYDWAPHSVPGVFFNGIMVAWNGGAFDTKRNRLLIFGGGHTDYGGNEIYGFDFNDFKWHLVAAPSSFEDIMAHQATKDEDQKKYYPDGLPVSRHTQNYIAYHPQWDAMVSIGYRGGYRLPDSSNNFDYYDFTAGHWVTDAKQRFPGSFSKCVEVDIKTGNIWVYALRNDRKLWEYNCVTDTWTRRYRQMPHHGWDPYTILKIDPQKRRCLVLGSGKYFVYDISAFDYDKHVKLVSNVSSGPQTPVNSGHPTIAFDSHTGFMVSWIGGTSVYAVDLSKNVWTEIKASSENKVIPTKPAYGGTYGRWQYVTSLKVFALVNSTDENVFLYKFSSDKQDNTPPEITSFSIPKVSDSKSIGLKITAHDNVGIVGYLITESNDAPDIDDPGWLLDKPSDWRASSNGSHHLFLWVKDLAGNISVGKKQTITINADIEAPHITGFKTAAQVSRLTIPVDSLHAADDVAVTGYLITESAVPPPADSGRWKKDPPKTFTASGCGDLTLYAWAKDAEGNISTSMSSQVSVKLSHTPGALLVGPRHRCKSIAKALKDAKDGDVIEVDAGVYDHDILVVKLNNLTIRGIGGYAHIRGTRKIRNGKGLIVQYGNALHLEKIELSGARVSDKNGAGVRDDKGDLTIRNCYIHDNENGILTGAIKGAAILIERSIFDSNGYGDGSTHNIYVGGIGSLILRHNIIENAKKGHNIKSRAQKNCIEFNAILELKNKTSYAIDIPNGGAASIYGNLIQQGSDPENNSIISYKQSESRPWNEGRTLCMIKNVIIDDYAGRSYVIRSGLGTDKIIFKNNVFWGDKQDLIWAGRGKEPEKAGNAIHTGLHSTRSLISSFRKSIVSQDAPSKIKDGPVCNFCQ